MQDYPDISESFPRWYYDLDGDFVSHVQIPKKSKYCYISQLDKHHRRSNMTEKSTAKSR